jgi:hypothetical protein
LILCCVKDLIKHAKVGALGTKSNRKGARSIKMQAEHSRADAHHKISRGENRRNTGKNNVTDADTTRPPQAGFITLPYTFN